MKEKEEEPVQQLQNTQKILEILNKNNIFLIDIDKLEEISIYKKSKNLEINFLKYFQQHQKVSFGCFFEDFKKIGEEVYLKVLTRDLKE